MKILCLLDAFWPDYGGGIVKAVLPEIEQLARDGHQVVVLARRLSATSASLEDRELYRFFRYGTVSLGLASGPISSRFHLPAILRQLHKQYAFDVVYANNFQQTRIAESVLPVPVLMAYHASAYREISIDLEYGKYGTLTPFVKCANYWVRHVEGSAIANATRVMTRSHYMVEDLRGLYPRSATKSIDNVPLCVDTEKYRYEARPQVARSALSLPQDRVILFTVRRLVPRMGIEKLIDAMQLVRKQHPNALLLIGGKGPLEEVLQKKIEDSGLQDQVRMLGFISEDDLVLYYQSADLFVLPTSAYEGFGLVTLESWSCGTPVVCTPVGANSEVVGPFGEEWIMPSADSAGIAKGLLTTIPLLNDPQLRQRCRDYCDENFTPARVVKQIEALLEATAKVGTRRASA
jgi:glycosyltransferase involved in cell wall biosynthesis